MRTRVVIVGAGLSGASTAFQLRERLGDEVDITVLEANDHVGGRAHRLEFAGETIEVGGTLLHSTNSLVLDMMQRLDIGRARAAEDTPASSGAIGIWDGDRFALHIKRGGWRFLATLVARYRLRPLRALAAAAKDGLARVESLYPQVAAGRSFYSPAALAEAGGLTELTTVSLADHLIKKGVSRRVVDEIATGILRNMYNQHPDISAMAGIVGVIGAGLAGGSLFSVEGGNHLIAEGSLRLANATVRTGARVTEIRADRTVVLADGSTVAADIVVLAVPLAVAGIELPTSIALPKTEYRRVYVTLVAGNPSAAYFGTATPPSTILSTANEKNPFRSLGRIGWSREAGVPIFKFFSLEPITDELVVRLMDDVRVIDRLEWDAYPIMRVDPATAPFELAPGIFFANALEPIFSTLETETLAGRVVGNLVAESVSA